MDPNRQKFLSLRYTRLSSNWLNLCTKLSILIFEAPCFNSYQDLPELFHYVVGFAQLKTILYSCYPQKVLHSLSHAGFNLNEKIAACDADASARGVAKALR